MSLNVGGKENMDRGFIELDARLPTSGATLMWIERRGWSRGEPREIGPTTTLPARITLGAQ